MVDINGNKLLKPSPLKMIGSIIGAGVGIFGAIKGAKDKRAARKKMDAAQKAINKNKEDYAAIDTSNPFEDTKNHMAGMKNVYEGAENVYAGKMENKFEGQKNAFEGMKNEFEGMENAFEDLTVNTQQAEFEAQQNAQNQANILSSMAGAAGGSGIAALAQSMANQGALQAQKASASIGAQEAANAKKAAEASQDISMATAAEGSKQAMAQAQEQSRLDTQKRQADMDIQATVLGAEEKLQAAKLDEASKLQMAEREGAERAEIRKGEGQMWSAEKEMQKQETLMSQNMAEMQMHHADKQAADKAMMEGIGGAAKGIGGIISGISDERLKENINKIKYSDSGIPIYTFKYKGDNRTWIGTMAQDLIRLGKEYAVTKGNDGYYRVKYNLIDVDMKEIKLSSPLKQLGGPGGPGGPGGADPAMAQANQANEMMKAANDILSAGAQERAWEQKQLDIRAVEPGQQQARKRKDQALREEQKKLVDAGGGMELSRQYVDVYRKQLQELQDELYVALKAGDKIIEKEVMMKAAQLSETQKIIKEAKQEFYEDHFQGESQLSRSVSQQQVSFATQMYCENPELRVVFPVQKDVDMGTKDYYGDLVQIGIQYCIVYTFDGTVTLIPVTKGNKDMYLVDKTKALEYQDFRKEQSDIATKARENGSTSKINSGMINYKMDTMFGNNDGTASKEQDELVLQFAWDEAILQDGSSFRRDLYEHPAIQTLNYGKLDLSIIDGKDGQLLPLSDKDVNHWSDDITEEDKLKIVDAIVNQDNPFFDIKLLRTLIKEYYTYKIENAWWKGMGYEEGKLAILKMKAMEMVKHRFKKAKAQAIEEGKEEFLFDGNVHKTGVGKGEKPDETLKAPKKI